MQFLKVWLFALALSLSLLAGQASAQTAKTPWVVRCEYTSHDGGTQPYLYSKPFIVEGEAPSMAQTMADEWFAMLKAKRGVAGYRSDVNCHMSPESSLRYVMELLHRSSGSGTLELDWMPAYGALYTLPREMYYFCVATDQSNTQQFYTDLFKAPRPASMTDFMSAMKKADSAHTTWLNSQGVDYSITNKRCDAVGPEPFQAYAAGLDNYGQRSDRARLTRSAWPGIDPAAAPNLIDDLAARARYAKMRITAPATTPKATAPKPAPVTKPVAITKPSLTIKSDTAPRDLGKAWDEQVRKTLAAEAQKKIENAAKAAQADAKYQAELEAFFRERRKRGRAQ